MFGEREVAKTRCVLCMRKRYEASMHGDGERCEVGDVEIRRMCEKDERGTAQERFSLVLVCAIHMHVYHMLSSSPFPHNTGCKESLAEGVLLVHHLHCAPCCHHGTLETLYQCKALLVHTLAV